MTIEEIRKMQEDFSNPAYKAGDTMPRDRAIEWLLKGEEAIQAIRANDLREKILAASLAGNEAIRECNGLYQQILDGWPEYAPSGPRRRKAKG